MNENEVPVEPTADTENKPDKSLTSEVNIKIDTDVRTDQATRQKNGDDSGNEATTDSSKSADDTSDNGVPNVAANRNSDAPHRSVDETCEEFYIKDSGSDPHRLHALNSDNEDGGDKDKETTGVSDTAIAQLAKESNCTSYEMRHGSRPLTASTISIYIGQEERTEQIKVKEGSRDKGKRDMRLDSTGPIEDTSDDKGPEKDDGKSSSFRHREVRKDEESKHCGVKGPIERTCQETYLNKGTLGSCTNVITEGNNDTNQEFRGSAPPAAPTIEIRFAHDIFKEDYNEYDASHYEFYEMTKTEYEISLLPTGKGLQSLPEVSSEICE